MNTSMIFIKIGAASLITGCASLGSGNQNRADPTIETQASNLAHVHADVRRDQLAWQVVGEVHKPHHGMGNIPGHVDIEVMAADGRVLARTSNGYHHRSRRSRYSWLLVDLPEVDEPVAAFRVIHHNAGRTQTPADV